jgi:hypothetical protein
MTDKGANWMYDKILRRIVIPLVGNETTYQNDLEKAGIKLLGSQFKGVFPSDKIPVLNDLKPYAIVNLDKSTESGSHWIAVAYGGDKTYIYDSFGRKATVIIPSIINSGNGRIVNTDKDAEQKDEETNCGARALTFLVFFHKYGAKNAMFI